LHIKLQIEQEYSESADPRQGQVVENCPTGILQFLDPDPEANDFRVGTSSFRDTPRSVVKFARRSIGSFYVKLLTDRPTPGKT